MSLTIGQAARAAHVHIETLRYYERRGLVARPPRSISRYRRYPEDIVPRVQFVKHAQALGFSLKEIRELLSLKASPRAHCADVKVRTQSKIKEIDLKIRRLEAIRRALTRLVSQCDGKLPASACPILESMDSAPRG